MSGEDPGQRRAVLSQKMHRLRMSPAFLDGDKKAVAEVERLRREMDELGDQNTTTGHRFAREVLKRAPIEQEPTE